MPEPLIVLLRGVMPTGRNRVPVAAWRDAMQDAGFGRPRTVVASGNAVVDSPWRPDEAAERMHALIADRIGATVDVFVRTVPEIRALRDEWPYEPDHPVGRSLMMILDRQPQAEAVERLRARDDADVRWQLDGTRLWAAYDGGVSDSRFVHATIERALGVRCTGRTRGTIDKLLALADAD